MKKTLFFLLITFSHIAIFAQKPNIWILSDLTAASSYTVTSSTSEAVTDQNSDPDDQVALATYLMLANKFSTVRIVLAATPRKTTQDAVQFFNAVFRPAYAADYINLSKNIDGYPTPESFLVLHASTSGVNYIKFNNMTDTQYADLNSLPQTVKLLVEELSKIVYSPNNPLYVSVWGPLTEAAMAVKHLQLTNNTSALNNLFIVSHWTTSFTNQGTPATPFDVANCNSDGEACSFLHSEAQKTGAAFKFVDVGSIGQSGIVTGSGSWFSGGLSGTRATQLRKSKLGELLIKSKFVFGKPDGSDCGSYFSILGTYGVTLNNFTNNGALTQTQEETTRDIYKTTASRIYDDLLSISNMALAPTSIENVSVEKNDWLYPNPSKNNIVINFKEVNENTNVEIIDSQGKIIYNNKYINTEKIFINNLNLSSGIYLVRVKLEDKTVSKKLIIS